MEFILFKLQTSFLGFFCLHFDKTLGWTFSVVWCVEILFHLIRFSSSIMQISMLQMVLVLFWQKKVNLIFQRIFSHRSVNLLLHGWGKTPKFMKYLLDLNPRRFKKLPVEMFSSRCLMCGLILHMFTLLKATLHWQWKWYVLVISSIFSYFSGCIFTQHWICWCLILAVPKLLAEILS